MSHRSIALRSIATIVAFSLAIPQGAIAQARIAPAAAPLVLAPDGGYDHDGAVRPDEVKQAAPAEPRLVFAQEIDADDDAATNPADGTPVPVEELVGRLAGRINVAVLVPNDAAGRPPVGTPVTVRLWPSNGPKIERTVRADAWGAAFVSFTVRDVDQEYTYQASAPGHAATETRRFRFDTARRSFVARMDGARLVSHRRADGTLSVSVHSPYALDGDGEVVLVVGRKPAHRPDALIAVLPSERDEMPDFEPYLHLPRLAMKAAGSHHATLDLKLPPGDYVLFGSLLLPGRSEDADRPSRVLFSQRATLTIPEDGSDDGSAAASSRNRPALSISALPFDRGRHLVQYAAPAGRAEFGLVDEADLNDVRLVEATGVPAVERRRVGAFAWEEIRREVRTTILVDDGKKRAWIKDARYDPLRRSYIIAVQSLQDEPVTDWLRVDVLGPGGVVLKHEDVQVTLQPDKLLEHLVEVPAALGKPHGLRVSLDDPLVQEMTIAERRTRSIDSATETPSGDTDLESMTDEMLVGMVLIGKSVFASAHFKVVAQVFGFVLAQFDYPAKVVWEWLPQSDIYVIFYDVIDYFGFSAFENPGEGGNYRFKAGSASIDGRVGGGIFADVKPRCNNAIDEHKAIHDSLKRSAAELINYLNSNSALQKLSKPWQTPVIRLVPFLFGFFWAGVWGTLTISVTPDVNFDDASFTMQLNIKAGATAELSAGIVGLGLPIFDDFAKFQAIVATSAALVQVARMMKNIAQGVRKLRAKGCNAERDPPEPHPADDRQDLWDDMSDLVGAPVGNDSLDRLRELRDRALTLGLTLAARFLEPEIATAELEAFAGSGDSVGHWEAVAALYATHGATITGLLSGTVPLSPTGSLSLSVQAANDALNADLAALPFARQRRALLDALFDAERQAASLVGSELELQHELRLLLSAGVVGVLSVGLPGATVFALTNAGLPYQLVSLFPQGDRVGDVIAPYMRPDEAPRALVVPSAGMYPVMQSAEARMWLEDYVRGGGTLVVFTQAFDEDWAALPGGQVRGVGYQQDQRCEHETVRAVMPSNWLTWMGKPMPDVQVDGAFTHWPADADVLLVRTSGTYIGYPAMIEYHLGEGRVLATTAYGDWAVSTAIWWGDDWAMTRSILIRAWMLANGQDINAAVAVGPSTDFVAQVPVTNSSPLTVTGVEAGFNVLPKVWIYGTSTDYTTRFSRPAELAPGQTAVVTGSLRTPPLLRATDHSHQWSRAGLYRYSTKLTAPGAAPINGWDGFIRITTPVTIGNVSLVLSADAAAVPPGRPLVVTATVRNFAAAAQTMLVRGELNLPTTTVTLTVPGGGSIQLGYGLVMTGSRNVRLAVFDLANQRLSQASLALYVASPRLRAALAPPALDIGQPFTVTVRNRPIEGQPSVLSPISTLRVTVTQPSGGVVVAAARSLPELRPGDVRPELFQLPAGLTDTGVYTVQARIVYSGSVEDADEAPAWPCTPPGAICTSASTSPPMQAWWLTTRVTIGGGFAAAGHAVRSPGTFVARVSSTGVSGMASPVTVSVPAFGLSWTGVVTVTEIGGTFGVSFTVPATATATAYPLVVEAGQGELVSRTFSLVVAPSRIQFTAEPQTGLSAGGVLSMALRNVGGVDSSAEVMVDLRDRAGVRVVHITATAAVSAQATVRVPIGLPGMLADGPYWLNVSGLDQTTLQPFVGGMSMTISGVQAALAAWPGAPTYVSGAQVAAHAAVTAVQGDVTGVVRLTIRSDQPMTLTWDAPERVNDGQDGSDPGQPSFVTHQSPAIAADAQGNFYAVWVDWRETAPYPAGRNDYYFAWRSPVSMTWSQNERVGAPGKACAPGYNGDNPYQDVAVDGQGVVHMIAVCAAAYGISYTQRLTTGVWTAWEDVVTGGTNNFHRKPTLGADAAGNVYAAWVNDQVGADSVYFANRPAGGGWSSPEKADVGASAASGVDIAVSPTGTVYLLHRNTYTGSPGVYFQTRDLTGTWSAQEMVVFGNAGSYDSVPRLALDDLGQVHATWAMSLAIRYARRTITGTWTAVETAHGQYPAGGYMRAPSIAVSPDGTPVIAAIGYAFIPGSEFYWLRTVQRAISGTWSFSSPLTDSTESRAAVVAVAPDGAVGVIWHDQNDFAGIDQGKILGSFRTLSTGWGAPHLVNDDRGGGAQERPVIDLDAAGNVYAAWLDGRELYTSTRFARRDATSGLWQSEVKVNSITPTAGLSVPQTAHVAVNDAGKALVTWRAQWATSGYRLWGAARSITGTWTPNRPGQTGSALSFAIPRAVLDQDGGGDVAYTSAGPDVSVVRWLVTDTFGTPVRVNDTVTGAQQTPSLAVDGEGVRRVGWHDTNGAGSVWSKRSTAYGTWLPDERVDVGSTKPNPRQPWLAVDGSGAAYALWRYNDNVLRFAKQPNGTDWLPAETITAGGTMTNDLVGLAVDPLGNAFIAWVEYSGSGPDKIGVRARSSAGVWLPAQMLATDKADAPWLASNTVGEGHIAWRQRNPDGPGTNNLDIYYTKLFLDGADPVVWSAEFPIGTVSSQALSVAVGLLSGLPGKYTLRAEVRNVLSQTLAESAGAFYIHPADAIVTLETDPANLAPGQATTARGWLTNPSASAVMYTLTVRADAVALLNQPHTLGAGEGVSYSVAFTLSGSALLMAEAQVAGGTLLAAAPRARARANSGGAAVAHQLVRVSPPVVEAAIEVPDPVAAPFTATLTLSNTGPSAVTLTARLGGGPPVALRLDPGEVAGVTGEMIGASRSLGYVQAVIEGDTTFTATTGANWGEAASLSLTAPVSPVEGLVPIVWSVAGTGPLPFDAVLVWRIDGSAVTQTAVAVLPGVAATGHAVFDLAAGARQVAVSLTDTYSNVVVTASSAFTVSPSRPLEANVRIAGLRAVTATSTVFVTVTNEGGQAEPTVLGAQLYDLPVQLVITPAAASTQVYSVALPAPVDMPGGVYAGEVTLEEQRVPFTMTRRASTITMTLGANKVAYAPNETVTLSVRLTESANLGATYNVWLRYGEYDRFVTTTVAGNGRVTVTLVFSALAATERVGVGLAYTPTTGATAARTIMFDSVLVQVVDASRGARLQFNKSAPYAAGETVFYTATISSAYNTVRVFPPVADMSAYSNALLWTAPTTDGLAITGTYPLTFVIPAGVPSKRHTFVLNADGETDDYPVDVRGTSVLVRRASVTEAPRGKTGLITGVVELVNLGGTVGGLRLWAFVERPDSDQAIELSPVVSRLITVSPGVNVFIITGTYTTPSVGPHRLRVDVRAPGSFHRTSAAMMQFDVGDARLVDVSTDHGTYGVGDPGIGRVDVFGHGAALVVVTATTGVTLFAATAGLNGYATFTFPVPTGAVGDVALVGRLTDAAGNVDERLRVYAVAEPPDSVPPTLTVAVPATTTFIVSNAPTATLIVEGAAADDRGAVSVSANGEVTTANGGAFAVPVVLRQGFNLVAVSAADASGNYTTAAAVAVYVQPARAITLSPNAASVRPGERVTFTLSLAAGADVEESTAAIQVPTALITGVIAEASTGGVSVSGLGSTTATAVWSGSVLSTTPTVVRIGAMATSTGTLPGLGRVLWGFGSQDQAAEEVSVTSRFLRFVPGTMRDAPGQW